MHTYFSNILELIQANLIIFIGISGLITASIIFAYVVSHSIYLKSNATIEDVVSIRKNVKVVTFKTIKDASKKRFNFVEKGLKKSESLMYQVGETSRAYIVMFFILKDINPILLAVGYTARALIDNNFMQLPRILFTAILLFAFSKGFIFLIITILKNNQNDRFKRDAYKIYKFLNNQLSSGVKVNDAVLSLHKAVDDKLLKKRLLLFASTYVGTNDISKALLHITDFYKSYEAQSLAIVIQQGIKTGMNTDIYKKKEKRLFNVYITIIQKETQLMNLKYFGVALLFGTALIMLLGYPMILNLNKAQETIFYSHY